MKNRILPAISFLILFQSLFLPCLPLASMSGVFNARVTTESQMIIDDAQYTWYGDLIVNGNESLLIENCSFTIESGSILVLGELNISDSVVKMHYPTSALKIINVYGNLTICGSTMTPAIALTCFSGSQAEICNSSCFGSILCNEGSQASILDSNLETLITWDSVELTHSNVSRVLYLYWDYLEAFSAVDCNINYVGLVDCMGDLQVKSGINENVSFVSNGGYINFLNSYVGGWDLQPAGPTRIVNSDLDSLDLEVSDSWTGLIILTPGYVEYRELDWNFEPVVIENSSIANYAIAVMSNNNLEIVNSGFAQILGQSCNMTIRNSNVSQLCCIRSGMFMIVNSTIDNCCLIQLRHCSLNLTLTEGFHDYFNILAEEISLNLTLLNSNVKTWRVSASTGVQLELHDSELSAWSFALGGNVVKADVLSLGGDAHCGFFNSTIERVRCTGSADLTLENCKVEILYIYGSANVTAINSVIKTVITDPSSVKLNNSLVILSMDFAFQFTGDDGVSVLYSKDATIPLPANAEAFSSYANVTTSQGESFSAQVKMYYNETEVLTAGIKENRLRIYFLADQGVWETCPVQGVDSDENYVWANVTSLSTFVVVYGGPVHDLAVLDLKSEKTVFAEDQIATVNVTVANNGDFAESFNVTSLVNGTVVDLQSLTVQSSDLASFTFELNTTAVLKGHYTLIAQVSPVENETNVGNNALSLSVTITIPGDVNGDMTVDIYDAIVLAGAYNSHAGSPNWNPNADINCDSTVDIYDAIILANHYNQHYP